MLHSLTMVGRIIFMDNQVIAKTAAPILGTEKTYLRLRVEYVILASFLRNLYLKPGRFNANISYFWNQFVFKDTAIFVKSGFIWPKTENAQEVIRNKAGKRYPIYF